MAVSLAASTVTSTPVGLLAFVASIALIGGFLGSVATIRRTIIKPVKTAAEKLHDLADLPDSVRDLTQTLTRYVADNETQRASTEERLARVENTLSLWAFRTFGPPDEQRPQGGHDA